MPRFVILEHDHPTLHWDLMLEHEGSLKTWRLPRPPDAWGEHSCLPGEQTPVAQAGKQESLPHALPLPEHRLMYLDYEGPVSGNRGHVKRWDAGTYESIHRDARSWTVRLAGKRWQGVLTLPFLEKKA